MSLNFYISDMNVDADASYAKLVGQHVAQDIELPTADVHATVDVSASVLQQLFNFSTEHTDVNDIIQGGRAGDIVYRVSYSRYNLETALGIDINSNVTCYAGNYYTSTGSLNPTYDYVRYLADNLFNTSLGTDLFSNETELRTNLRDTFTNNFDTRLTYLQTIGQRWPITTTYNPGKYILDNILRNAPERLSDLTQYTLPDHATFHKMPILAGDKIYMLFTVSAAEDQEDLTGSFPIFDRKYLIRIVAV